ncbi:expansin-like protein [Cavenderia fasciculata]|uniref:Expansin-like protein n=1 Tax=Cavenderia fasciculata TaxID=261658 RepID=F4PNX0_CACFS|nr:expansin-like protein [Cavenderia fasciculata]EGG23173.1 expansin-like protein [Cavenderia fasciculata]|eukprot:XP_004361024.1 expansin-like protein [Cavenderia fasciculata]
MCIAPNKDVTGEEQQVKGITSTTHDDDIFNCCTNTINNNNNNNQQHQFNSNNIIIMYHSNSNNNLIIILIFLILTCCILTDNNNNHRVDASPPRKLPPEEEEGLIFSDDSVLENSNDLLTEKPKQQQQQHQQTSSSKSHRLSEAELLLNGVGDDFEQPPLLPPKPTTSSTTTTTTGKILPPKTTTTTTGPKSTLPPLSTTTGTGSKPSLPPHTGTTTTSKPRITTSTSTSTTTTGKPPVTSKPSLPPLSTTTGTGTTKPSVIPPTTIKPSLTPLTTSNIKPRATTTTSSTTGNKLPPIDGEEEEPPQDEDELFTPTKKPTRVPIRSTTTTTTATPKSTTTTTKTGTTTSKIGTTTTSKISTPTPITKLTVPPKNVEPTKSSTLTTLTGRTIGGSSRTTGKHGLDEIPSGNDDEELLFPKGASSASSSLTSKSTNGGTGKIPKQTKAPTPKPTLVPRKVNEINGPIPLGPCGSGSCIATEQLSVRGMCQLPVPTAMGMAAISKGFFSGGQRCGQCFRLTGPLGSVVVMVTDMCNQGEDCGQTDRAHFIIANVDYEKIALRNQTSEIYSLGYQEVSCEHEGNINATFLGGGEGSMDYAYYFRVMFSNYAVGITSVQVRGTGMKGYQKMKLENGGWTWNKADNGPKFAFPGSLLVGGSDGEYMAYEFDKAKGNLAYNTLKQFTPSPGVNDTKICTLALVPEYMYDDHLTYGWDVYQSFNFTEFTIDDTNDPYSGITNIRIELEAYGGVVFSREGGFTTKYLKSVSFACKVHKGKPIPSLRIYFEKSGIPTSLPNQLSYEWQIFTVYVDGLQPNDIEYALAFKSALGVQTVIYLDYIKWEFTTDIPDSPEVEAHTGNPAQLSTMSRPLITTSTGATSGTSLGSSSLGGILDYLDSSSTTYGLLGTTNTGGSRKNLNTTDNSNDASSHLNSIPTTTTIKIILLSLSILIII